MILRELLLLLVLAVAALAVTRGVFLIYEPAGWMVGGILAAALGAFFLFDDGRSE